MPTRIRGPHQASKADAGRDARHDKGRWSLRAGVRVGKLLRRHVQMMQDCVGEGIEYLGHVVNRTKAPMPISNKGSDDGPQQSLFSLMCGAAQFAPHVHPDEVQTVQHSCVGRSRRNIITCADGHLDEFLDEVRGLDMSTVNLRGRLLPLDLFIPVVPRGMFRRAAYEVPFPVVGVMINDVLTKRVRSRYGYYYMPRTRASTRRCYGIRSLEASKSFCCPVVRTF